MGPFLPYGRQTVDQDDVAAVVEALKSDFLTSGPRVPAFETAFARAVGASEAVACNSGTAALHLAYAALGVGPGDVVIVPAITFLATANAARYLGADVVFADVDPLSGLMTPETLSAAVKETRQGGRFGKARIKAVVPVHLNGWIADVREIAKLASFEAEAQVVEDACHALGGTWWDHSRDARRQVGDCTYSAAATFSFHPVKAITMGEGGAISTNDPAMAATMRTLRSHGMVRSPESFLNRELAFGPDGQVNPWYYEMHEPGWNHRATDISCALGMTQLAKLSRFVSRRLALLECYGRLLEPLREIVRMVPRLPDQTPGLHLLAVQIDFAKAGKDRGSVMRALAERGVGSQVHYVPVCRQPYYERLYGARRLPGAEYYYSRVLSLPLYVSMMEEDVSRVVDALQAVLA